MEEPGRGPTMMGGGRARPGVRGSEATPLDPDLGPIPFMAHAQAAGHAVRANEPDEYDALADLFLGDDRPVPSEPPEPEDLAALIARGPGSAEGNASAAEVLTSLAGRPGGTDMGMGGPMGQRLGVQVEGAVLGHLPVLGSIWLTQLARHRARTAGRAVAVVRVTPEDAMIDLVSPAPTGRVIAARSFEDAVAQARSMGVRDWFVRVPESDEATLLGLAASGALATMTVLTGADDAAIVSAYRTLKSLVTSAGREDAPVRVAVMGASSARAHEARMKLAEACRAFLRRQLDVEACDQQISGGGSTLTLYRGARPAGLEDLIASLHESAEAEPARSKIATQSAQSHGPKADQEIASEHAPTATVKPIARAGATARADTLTGQIVSPGLDAWGAAIVSAANVPTDLPTSTPSTSVPGLSMPQVSRLGISTTGLALQGVPAPGFNSASMSTPTELEWDAEFRPARGHALAPARTPAANVSIKGPTRALERDVSTIAAQPETQPADAVTGRRVAPASEAESSAPTHPATTPSATTPAPVATPAAPPALAGAIRLGLRPIKARCPYAKSIELAVDGSKSLHLISSDGSEQGVQDLASAEAWAKMNAELLSDAYGIDALGPISRHVVTRRPNAMRGLMDSDVRLHALAKADADGWACVPLNG